MSELNETPEVPPPSIPDAPSEPMDAKAIAKLVGCKLEDVPRLSPKHLPRPNNKGIYPFMRTMEGVCRYLRRQIHEISTKDLAELLGVSTARIAAMQKEGVLTQLAHGRFDRAESILGLVKWFKAKIGQGEHSAVRIRSKKADIETQLMEIQLSRAKGESYDRRAVDAAWAHLVLLVRQKLLLLPGKIAPRIPYLKNEIEAQAEILRELEEILTELARPIDYEDGTEESE